MAWLSGWAKRVKLTTDQTDIDADLTNFPILAYLSASSGSAKGVTLTPESTNPVLTATETWEGTAVIESSIIMDGSQCDMWYRGYNAGVSKIGYAYATDSKCAVWTKYASNPLTDIPTGYQLPYVLKHNGTYYMFVQNGAANGDIYLYSSTNKTSWTVMNSGNPVFTHSATATDWYHLVYNVGVTIVGSTWHMLIEGLADSGAYSTKFQIGYSYSNLTDLNWNTHLSTLPVIPTSGNPDLIYVPDRNSLLSIHGEDSGTYWTIVADYASLSDDLSLAASWHRSSNFEIAATSIHVADPHLCVTNFTKDYNIVISYGYNQVSIYQTYSNLSLTSFFDKIKGGYDLSFVFDELQSDANRKKIAVTTSDGTTQCYVEIEKWDDANEKAWLWVKAPSILGATDTDFYLYYDSTHADNTDYVGDPNSTPAENVWDANFKAVYHMRDGASTSAIYDSTSNNKDGTKKGAAEPAITTDANGKVSEAQLFDGTDDDINLGSVLSSDTITVEAWAKHTKTLVSGYNYGIVASQTWVAGKMEFGPMYATASTYYLAFDVYSVLTPKSTTIFSNNTWYCFAGTYDKTGTSQKWYYNGILDKTLTSGQTWYTVDLTNLDIGDFLSGRYFGGTIDEVRISNIVRTIAWLKATYETERDHLLDWGSEEVLGSVSITPSPGQAIASVVAPVALVEGSVSITPSPAQAIASVVAPTAITERAITTSALYGVATYGNAVYGVVREEGLAVTPIPIQAKASVVAPTVIKGSVSITPAYAKAKAQVVQPTVKLGNITYAPTFIRAIAKALDPTVALGAVKPSPASAKAAGANPVIVLSSLSITPTAIHAIAQVVPPIVGVETPVYVTPDPASSLAGVVAPTVVCGAIVIIPSPLSAIVSVIAPTVRQGNIYLTPQYAKALAKITAPTVIQASLTIAPESVKAISRGQNPSVILASMTISPAFVRALAGVINPTVFQAWIGKKLQVTVITTTARQVDILTTQKRRGDVVTTQKRNVTVVTGE